MKTKFWGQGCIAIGVAIVATMPAVATTTLIPTSTWDGGGGDALWSTAANWTGDLAPSAGTRLVFPAGAARLANQNDFASGTSFHSITVEGGGYTLAGNPVSLSGGLEVTASAGGSNWISLPIQFPGAGTITKSGTMTCLVSGATSLGGKLTLSATDGAISLWGAISGSGGIEKTGPGVATLDGANGFAGTTTVSAGELTVRQAGGLGTAASGTTVAAGATLRFDQSVTVEEPILLAGGRLQAAAFTELELTGPLQLDAASAIEVDSLGVITVRGPVTGSFGWTKKGPGRVDLVGEGTYTGGTLVEAGALHVNGATGGGIAASAVSVLPGATLGISSDGVTGPVTSTGGTVCLGCGGGNDGASGDLELDADSTYRVFLGGAAPGGFSRLEVTGTVDLGGAAMPVDVDYAPSLGHSWVVLANDGTDAIVGGFAGLAEGATLQADGQSLQITYAGGDGNDVELSFVDDSIFSDGFEIGSVVGWSDSAGYLGSLPDAFDARAGRLRLDAHVEGSLASFGAVALVALGGGGEPVARLELRESAEGRRMRLCAGSLCGESRLLSSLDRHPALEWSLAGLLLVDGEAIAAGVETRDPVAGIELRRMPTDPR